MFRNVHTVPRGNGWANVRVGSTRPSSVHRNQEEAIARGREIARASRVEHIIHGRDGRIRARNSYGHDPHPPQG
jgi:hypothetical protein